MSCDCGGRYISLTEEMVMNPDYFPEHMKDRRIYRIEYGFECSCPEGWIILPPNADPDTIERILNNE